ncbi:pyridoxamine 5'-phosphate oxidase family protein [Thiohalophilus thiocyanatoxydans]|uniref:Pyridoxamine 5'-phosphate oxidase n=1 Tax=Thiohalophilus thiocyanatoxydans TaxID=381308 RepID=A0A4R8INL4_9GAMM|nr:pyridoxamine 5'-phosphate oxidase family protein [Thiohalophilus thiocyanatoxydans]TDX96897.1 pyridoxamine 5'-phosphate oxidase [Thiohalophilus thiocyanatoxydans]
MKVFEHIPPELVEWIGQQPLFFNATAPLDGAGHVNLSPRGLDTLRIVDPNTVVILDLTGSGNETAAHLSENGRMTLMFCAFSGPPRILRLYGAGEVIPPASPDWGELRGLFDDSLPGVRQLFHLQVERVQTSCGYGVPLMDLVGQREALIRWSEKKGPRGIREFRDQHNWRSIDGLPAPIVSDQE